MLVVRNLPDDVSANEVVDFFRAYGLRVWRADINHAKGFALLSIDHYEDEDWLLKAVGKYGWFTSWKGCHLKIEREEDFVFLQRRADCKRR